MREASDSVGTSAFATAGTSGSDTAPKGLKAFAKVSVSMGAPLSLSVELPPSSSSLLSCGDACGGCSLWLLGAGARPIAATSTLGASGSVAVKLAFILFSA